MADTVIARLVLLLVIASCQMGSAKNEVPTATSMDNDEATAGGSELQSMEAELEKAKYTIQQQQIRLKQLEADMSRENTIGTKNKKETEEKLQRCESNYEKTKRFEAEFQKASADLSSKESEIAKCRNDVEEFRKEAAKMVVNYGKEQKKVEEMEKQVKESAETINGMQTENEKLRQEMKDINDKHQSEVNARSECQKESATCKDDREKMIDDKKRRLVKLDSLSKDHAFTSDQLEKMTSERDRIRDENEKLEAAAKEAKAEASQLTKERFQTMGNLNNCQNSLQDCTTETDTMKSQNEALRKISMTSEDELNKNREKYEERIKILEESERKLILQVSVCAAILAIIIISKVLSYLWSKLFPASPPTKPVSAPASVKGGKNNKSKRT